MTSREKTIAVVVGAAILLGAAVGVTLNQTGHKDLLPFSSSEKARTLGAAPPPEANCEFQGPLNSQACFAAGIIRNVSLSNLQGAGQFCKWKGANPGEWAALKTYAETNPTTPPRIITWFGGHILNDLQAYFAAGGPEFTILPNTAPNVCKTPLAPPVVTGVTPGESTATVTVTSP